MYIITYYNHHISWSLYSIYDYPFIVSLSFDSDDPEEEEEEDNENGQLPLIVFAVGFVYDGRIPWSSPCGVCTHNACWFTYIYRHRPFIFSYIHITYICIINMSVQPNQDQKQKFGYFIPKNCLTLWRKLILLHGLLVQRLSLL